MEFLLIPRLVEIFYNCVDIFSDLFYYMSLPFSRLVTVVNLPSWLASLLSDLISNTSFGNTSILYFIIGSGVTFYVIYVVIKFLLDIVL